MGKTQSGAVWLSAEKTSPYDFYQYWRNIDDADVVKCLKMLTFLSLEEIEELAKLEGSEINRAKEILAHELTEMIHGKDEADKAQEAARALFGSKQNRRFCRRQHRHSRPVVQMRPDPLQERGQTPH